MKKEKSCGAVISKLDNGVRTILLIKHKNGGHWAFPKGHVENGETEVETAEREIWEETGLRTKIDTGFRYVVTYSPKKNIEKDVVYFSAEVISGAERSQPEEVMEIKWLPVDEAMNIITFQNDKNVLTDYIRYMDR